MVNYSKDDILFMKVENIFDIVERRIFTGIVKFTNENYMFGHGGISKKVCGGCAVNK